MSNVDAVVVTFNRINKLKECLKNLLVMDIDKIYVVNNASTDGTRAFLEKISKEQKKLQFFNLSKNTGGAGGFNYGVRKFIANSDNDYVWLMDDDTIPNQDALDKLLKGLQSLPQEKRGFSVGNTRWIDGNVAKMNIPEYMPEQKNSKYPLLSSASFVAILISRRAILSVGLPIKDFFIWGDDVEYTRRISSSGYYGIQVKDAVIIHKMGSNNNTNILSDNGDRINRYYYDYRNRIFLSKSQGKFRLLRTLLGRILWAFKIMFFNNDFKIRKLKILFRGTVDGLFFNPVIEHVNSKKLVKSANK